MNNQDNQPSSNNTLKSIDMTLLFKDYRKYYKNSYGIWIGDDGRFNENINENVKTDHWGSGPLSGNWGDDRFGSDYPYRDDQVIERFQMLNRWSPDDLGKMDYTDPDSTYMSVLDDIMYEHIDGETLENTLEEHWADEDEVKESIKKYSIEMLIELNNQYCLKTCEWHGHHKRYLETYKVGNKYGLLNDNDCRRIDLLDRIKNSNNEVNNPSNNEVNNPSNKEITKKQKRDDFWIKYGWDEPKDIELEIPCETCENCNLIKGMDADEVRHYLVKKLIISVLVTEIKKDFSELLSMDNLKKKSILIQKIFRGQAVRNRNPPVWKWKME